MSIVMAARELGKTLFESSQYAGRTRNDHDYVSDLYKTYLMRDPDPGGLAYWEGMVPSQGRDAIRRAFDESDEFKALASTISAVNSPSSSVSSLLSARIDPVNQPGSGLLGRDAQWNVPLLSLPGRAGLDLGLALSYSSAVWTRSGPYIYFDEDNGSPSPGFRLGFPTVQEQFFDAQAGQNTYLVITPGGRRIALRQVGSTSTYEAADSSYLQLIDSGANLLVRSTDGTQLTYTKLHNEWRCTQVKDRNGNYLSVNYNWLGQITNITDTLARLITFNYDSNANLQSITQTWNGQTHQWATFGWGVLTLSTNFSNVLLTGTVNGSVIPVLNQVGFADGTYTKFQYNGAAQVTRITNYASDSSPAVDNHPRNYTAYDYGASDDVARIVAARVWAEWWSGAFGVPAEVVTQFNLPGDGSHQMIAPDGTVSKEFYGSGWQKGLTTETQVWSGGVQQKRTTTIWTQDNTAVNYQTNPRVTETNTYDAAQNRKRTTIAYTTFALPGGASCSLPSDVHQYAADAATLIRRTHTDYTTSSAYLNQRLIGLVDTSYVYDGGGTIKAKTAYCYDCDPSQIFNTPAVPVQHDAAYDTTSLSLKRGNLMVTARWDADDPQNANKQLYSRLAYDTAGSVVFTRDPANHQNSLSYNDAFSDNESRNTFAYPTVVTDADGFSSTVQYNYDFGARTRVQGPPPANQSQGLIQTFTYDNAARPLQATTVNNGAYQRYVYGPTYVQSFATINNVADEAYSIQIFDGAGHIGVAADNHPGSAGGYRVVSMIYDLNGRLVQRSNPTETTGGWAPTGDDVAGWYYVHQSYDWQGRPLVSTNTDGTTKLASYSGCGCAGGEVVTITDEGTLDGGVAKRRQQKVYSDVLGRTVKTELLNWEGGSVYSVSVNTYNSMDQVTKVRQYAGAEGSGTYQETTMSYDGYGRLQTKHVPEQQVDPANPASTDHTTWTYNSDDTIQSVIDARGAVASYNYNSRLLLTGINYSLLAGVPTTGSSAVTVPPPVSFAYDAAQNRTSMTDGSGSTSYQYNSLSQIVSETRSFNGLTGSFPLAYEYALSGAVKKVTDQNVGTSFTASFDSAGRVSGMSTVGYGGGVTQYASNALYRAWGGLKSIAYGNNTSVNLGYNSRGMLSSYLLSGANYSGSIPLPVAGAYQYYSDGQIKFAQDQGTTNSIKDRAYQYDQSRRLKEGYSGTEARDYVNNTNVGLTDGPYRQSSTYDAWNNVLSGGGRFWSRNVVDTDTYDQFNRNPGWSYDAEGNVTSRNESFGDTLPARNYYDAAGRKTSVTQLRTCILEPQHISQLHLYTNTQTHDGNGHVTRYQHAHQIGINGTPTLRNTFSLRSTVLGGQVISEYAGSGSETLWNKTWIYAGGERIGSISRFGSASRNSWRATDPVTGDETITGDNGELTAQTTLDPNGVDVGLEDPFPPPGEDDDTCAIYDPNSIDSRPQAPRLNPFAGTANCVLDNIEQDCKSVGSEAAVQCRGNDCSSRIGEDGKVSQPFQAFSDGWGGFLPQGAKYDKNGEWFILSGDKDEFGRQRRVRPESGRFGLHFNHASSLPQHPTPKIEIAAETERLFKDCLAIVEGHLTDQLANTILNNNRSNQPVSLMIAHAAVESTLGVLLVGRNRPERELGLFQLKPSTARGLGLERFTNEQLRDDFALNTRLASTYLQQQIDAFGGDLRSGLGAYKQGAKSVRENGLTPNSQIYADAIRKCAKSIKR